MLRGLLIKRICVPLGERLRGWPVRRYLRELQDLQWRSADEIRRMLDSRLIKLVNHAYATVPYYRRTFDSLGVKPEDIKTADDLRVLPIITKQIVRDNFADLISDRYRESDLAVMHSSGSTGEPFRYLLSEEEKARKWANLFLLWSWGGFEIGDKYVNITGSPHKAFKSNRLLSYLESSLSGLLALTANELYESNAEDYVRRITKFAPKMVRGYASSLYYLAQAMQTRSLSMKVDCVFTTGETLFGFQRELMESVFGSKVYDEYGGEGIVIAGQCGHDPGYHINALSTVIELTDPSGNRCEPGVEGQVVLTDVNRYAMPLIRYNIQDVAVSSSRTCTCGRGLPMLERVSGRLTDIGITPSGKSVVVQFFTVMFKEMTSNVRGFQVVQEKPDLFVISVVPGPDFEEVRTRILEKTQNHLGSDVRVDLRLVDEIPATGAGKRRLFISKCGIQAAGADSRTRDDGGQNG